MWKVKRRARRGGAYAWGPWVEMECPYWMPDSWWEDAIELEAKEDVEKFLDAYGLFTNTAQREYRVVEEANHADK